MSVVADTSVWIEFFAGRPAEELEGALAQGVVILPPIVVAELVSGARRPRDQQAIAALVQEIPVHATPLTHWLRVGELRRRLLGHGLSVSVPDAHVAQCALDLAATLLAHDAIFAHVARHVPLRVRAG